MLRKTILIITLFIIVSSFASSGLGKYISLREFGIKIPEKNFYSRVGATVTGTVADADKARYIFENVYKGNRVEVTNNGDGNLTVRNTETGEEVSVDVTVTSPE